MTKSGAVDDVSEEWIREFVLSVYAKRDSSQPWYFSYDDLTYEIILKRKKDMKDTNNVIEKMKNLGLELCKVQYPDINHFSNYKHGDLDHVGEYDLMRFSILRGYVKLVGDTYVKQNSQVIDDLIKNEP